MKKLVVNADDFGHSAAVNGGVVEGHERGIVTSASLMVNRPGAHEAAEYARSQPQLGVGLHVELGEWEFSDGAWASRDEVAPDAVADEVRAQLDAFRDLTGREPTHLDSHQHVHRRDPARGVLLQVADDLGVPLRHYTEHVHYCGAFYGQTEEGMPLPDGISVESLIRIVRGLRDGTTELCCHPARGVVDGSSYAVERSRELEVLCDRRVRTALEADGVVLCTFREAA